MITVPEQFTDPATLGQYAGLVFLFFYFNREIKTIKEKMDRIIGALEGLKSV